MINKIITLKAKLFKGFADESRLSILELLASGSKCVSDLVAITELSQPNVSAHLKCLEECGLIIGERQGKHIYYSVADNKTLKILRDSEILVTKNKEKILNCLNYSK